MSLRNAVVSDQQEREGSFLLCLAKAIYVMQGPQGLLGRFEERELRRRRGLWERRRRRGELRRLMGVDMKAKAIPKFLLIINIMLNNYTETDIYHSCDVILPASSASGELLIGDFNSATDSDTLAKHNVKTIITAASGMEHLEVPPNILHITFPLLDAKSENIKRFFQDSYTAIKANLLRGGVLVHCAAGISRSATLVIAYLIKLRKISFREAITLVRARRKNICPNLGFQRQLKQYEKDVLEGQGRISMKKTVSQKISEERRTFYQNVQPVNQNDYFKFEPRTAEHSMRRKMEAIRKPQPLGLSQNRPRERKNFKVRPVNRELLYVYGQGQNMRDMQERQSLHLSQKIAPPLIQVHGRNGHPILGQYTLKKNY